MFSFFVPVSKVQKDRRVMRETDSRMTKYSRRGLIVNFLAFLICLYGGRFVDENPELTILLTIGLLLITFVRGVYVFRFDQIYPRAPAKWRNQYFIATLAGAVWWSVIMCSITLQLEMQNEAPLFWLYTMVFFSTTAHAFSPYQKFLTLYQLLGQIPAAFAAIYLGTLEAYLYAGVLLGFYFVLNHQCRLISENYWERLEASYALTRKTVSLEEEKKDTRASTRLNHEFLGFLVADFKKALKNSSTTSQDKLKTILKNTQDFQSILTKDIKLKTTIFNVRHELQSVAGTYVDKAEKKGVMLESSISTTLPMRLRGDSERFRAIIGNLIAICIKNARSGMVLLEAEFIREYEHAGELYITVSTIASSNKSLFSNKREAGSAHQENLQYVVSEGLAEVMDGSIEKDDTPNQGVRYRFNAKMELGDEAGQLDFHRNHFTGHTVLLVHGNAAIVDIKRQELEALGFTVITETQYKRAINVLLNNSRHQRPVEAVVYYFEGEGNEAFEFHEAIGKNAELRFVRQVVAASKAQKALFEKRRTQQLENIYTVAKPVGLFELESTFHLAYGNFIDTLSEGAGSFQNKNKSRGVIHCFSESSATNKSVCEKLSLEHMQVRTFSNPDAMLESLGDSPDVVLLDLSKRAVIKNLVQSLREAEQKSTAEFYVPIIGLEVKEDKNKKDFEPGVDDKVDLLSDDQEAISTIHYWTTLR